MEMEMPPLQQLRGGVQQETRPGAPATAAGGGGVRLLTWNPFFLYSCRLASCPSAVTGKKNLEVTAAGACTVLNFYSG